jgi:hypothetical protein
VIYLGDNEMSYFFQRNKVVRTVSVFLSIFFLLLITNSCKKSGQPETTKQTSDSNASTDLSVKLTDDVNFTEKIDLRILYAGLLGTERAKDFTDFLSKHFKEVKTTDYMTFTGTEPITFDVAIIDHNGLGFNAPLPKISPQYARATITMGVPGAFLCERLKLKTGYL